MAIAGGTDSRATDPRRIAGWMMAALAGLSLLFTLFAVYQVWSLRGRLGRTLDSGLVLVSDVLGATDRALGEADAQLALAAHGVDAAEQSSRGAADVVEATGESLRTSARIVGEELPASIASTRSAIQSARASARLVDDALGALAAIPLLGVDYRPEVPLDDELANVARSLDGLPSLTRNLGRELESTARDADSAGDQIQELADALRRSRDGLEGSRSSVASLRTQVAGARPQVDRARAEVPTALSWLAIGSSFVLGWLAIVQAVALAAGIELARPRGP